MEWSGPSSTSSAENGRHRGFWSISPSRERTMILLAVCRRRSRDTHRPLHEFAISFHLQSAEIERGSNNSYYFTRSAKVS
jgi:hypothetical protein